MNYMLHDILEDDAFITAPTEIEMLNANLDAERRQQEEYEAKAFASSCTYDASDELPF